MKGKSLPQIEIVSIGGKSSGLSLELTYHSTTSASTFRPLIRIDASFELVNPSSTRAPKPGSVPRDGCVLSFLCQGNSEERIWIRSRS